MIFERGSSDGTAQHFSVVSKELWECLIHFKAAVTFESNLSNLVPYNVSGNKISTCTDKQASADSCCKTNSLYSKKSVGKANSNMRRVLIVTVKVNIYF